MKKSKSIFLIIFGLIMFMAPKFGGGVQALPTYQLYEDSNGVRWQYVYIEDSDRVEISFFDNRNSRDSVTLPSLSNLRSNDSTIPTSATKLIVVNYVDKGLGTPTSQTKNITTINLSNATAVNGVSPMIQDDVVTTITFSSSVGTSIGEEAFMGYKLTINNLDKVVAVGDRAFKNAELTYKNLNLGNLITIGDAAFQGTNIEKVTMINTERIEYNAFRDCLELVSVKLGDNVKDIGDAAFQNAQKLTTINYNNVTKVGNFAFADCTSYNTDISNTKLTEIGDAAYSNTTGFTKSITIPDGVTFLGWRVFYKSGITGVDLNNVMYMNVTRDNIGAYINGRNNNSSFNGEGMTFADCPNLSEVKLGKVWYITYQAFANDKKITKVEFPDEVKAIGPGAFALCGITELDLNKVQRIDSSAFANNNITELYLPKSISWLAMQSGQFSNNPIEKVTIAFDTMAWNLGKHNQIYNPWLLADLFVGGLYSIDLDSQSINLNKQYINSGYEYSIKEVIFEAPYKDDEEAKIDSLFDSRRDTYADASSVNIISITNEEADYNQDQYKNIIRPNILYEIKSIEKIVVGEGYEYIGEQAFRVGTGNVGNYSFDTGSQIKEVILPSTLKGIGARAFEGQLEFDTKINLPNGLEYIGDKAFFDCSGFYENIDLPNLKYLGSSAFQDSGVGDFYLHDQLEFVGFQPFYMSDNYYGQRNTKNITIDFDLYGLDEYKAPYSFRSWNWSGANPGRFQHWVNYSFNRLSDYDYSYEKITFTDKVITPPCQGYSDKNANGTYSGSDDNSSSFMYGIHAKEIDLSATGWKTIGKNWFGDSEIDTIKLPKNLERIDDHAFYHATIKNLIEIPDTVKYIGQEAFAGGIDEKYISGKWQLNNFYKIQIKDLPNSLEYIGAGAFYNVDFTEDIVIPASVTNIIQKNIKNDKYLPYIDGTFGVLPQTSLENYVIEDEELKKFIHQEFNKFSVTFENDLLASLTDIEDYNHIVSIADMFYGRKINSIRFGKNVMELPTIMLSGNSEFYGLDVEEVIFENLKVLPPKAFIDDTNLKKVTFNNGLEKIGDFAFYNTSLEEVNLPDNNGTIEVGYSAFRKTNLESIGDDNSSLNVIDNKIVTTGPYVFADNNNLKTVIVPDGFNNNVIGEYTFKNCNNLNKVDVYRDIKTINSEAFNGDYNFKKLFLWGDTKIEQNNVDEISGSGKIKVINTSAYYREALEADPKAQLKFIIKSANGNVELTKAQIDYGYIYDYNGTGKVTFEHPSEVTVNLVKTSDGYIANIEDVKETKDYGDFTIPAATDLYSYSTYDVKNWEKDNSDTRRSEELGTDAKFYDLDEVLYLTSNHPKVKLNDKKDDFDKSDLIVYALRRDGVIMESDKWGEYTSHYASNSKDIAFEKYDSNTLEDAKMVYDTPYPAEEADVSTENFKSMRYEIVDAKGILPKKEIELYYTNSMIETTVDTMIEPTTVVDEIVDKITDTVDTGSGYVISTIVFLILSFLGLRFILLKRKNKLRKI